MCHLFQQGEKFELEFNFGPNYPLESPQVIFVGNNVPIHPHIYSNGHICLDVLYNHWSPVQTVASICLSLQSMLSSCTKKEPPPDNATYVKTARANPKHTAWAFHDDTV
ncbi:ubiquitin-conjugating enzyme E2 W [Modicella reniformis]|uniref:Ubiquitin-conjugating enzyme E2 W n=1 Tax=Modicella reniformis TaxID=1440133 RepID=A0A9P6IW88_9FUNG|nr:ubiquitin-conjugating enzyme E2 W [Modicella reniformis]